MRADLRSLTFDLTARTILPRDGALDVLCFGEGKSLHCERELDVKPFSARYFGGWRGKQAKGNFRFRCSAVKLAHLFGPLVALGEGLAPRVLLHHNLVGALSE